MAEVFKIEEIEEKVILVGVSRMEMTQRILLQNLRNW